MNFVVVARAIDELASLLTGEPLDPSDDSPQPPLPPEQRKLMEQIAEVLHKATSQARPDLLPLDLTNDALEDLEAMDDLLEQTFAARPPERIKLLKTMLEIMQEISAALIAASAEDAP